MESLRKDEGTAQRKFRIDSRNGTLWVFDHLDREKRDRYTFKVHATDNGIPKQSSFCTVNIWVKDVNDNAPKFVYPTQKNHTIYASVFTSPGIPLVKLTAVDMDEGENAQLSFHLDGNAAYQKVFNLNEHSGELSLATLNDPMNFVGRYELVMRVQDAGNPPLSGYANINIVLNKSVASSSESSRSLPRENKHGQSFEMLRHSNLKSWQSSSNTALDASPMSQRIQELQENRASDSDYALHSPHSRKQESHQTGRKALSSSTTAPYFTSERALIVVICLIALSALIAFVFLIAITLIRRRTTAFDVGQLSQGHQRPSSAPPQAGVGRGSVKISEDKFSTLMSVPAISALEEPGIWSAGGEFRRYPGSLGTAYEFVSRERCTPMCTTPTGTIHYEDKLDGDYTEQNQKPENGLQKPVETYRYSPVASSNLDQWKVFLPELHPRTSNQNGDASSCLVYPCETVQSQKSTENFPSVCLMLTQCDPRYERIKQCQRNKGCFDEPQDKFHNPAGHYSMQHLSQSPQEISSTARVKFVENADHYQDLRFSNYQPEILMNNESNVRKDCMPMENNVEIEATEHDHGTPKSDITPNT
ncbi:unnamed protein product [Calicophoron daubneyi]|uniref:Cadherin domain-containing protein n=1 Tax=Calicophoron daubneyi TaxID=300641 RepID=A0AAV2T9E7_CALDB